ncbi:GWxTD domain-containing protein [Candidatus Neomarinimicrobiota bacterium]
MTAIILIATLGLAGQASGQYAKARTDKEQPRFKTHISRFPTLHSDSIRVMISTSIPLDNLVFLKHEQGFRSTYEISVFAVNEEEMAQATKIWSEEVLIKDYIDTQSEDLSHSSFTDVELPLGKYEIVVNLVDLDNRKRAQVKKDIDLEAYPAEELTLGDLVLASGMKTEAGRPNYPIPYIDNRIGEEIDSFYVYMVIRNPDTSVTDGVIEYSMVDIDGSTTGVTYSILLDVRDILSDHLISIPTSLIRDKEQTLKFRVKVGAQEKEAEIDLQIAWTGISGTIENVDMAIDQTRYIASRKQIHAMKALHGEEVKRTKLLEFWAQLDPTPDTPKNEVMDEYYRRVAYSDAHFKSYQAGWETDLGMVYIIYGPPDDIERYPFELDSKPYQIWYYYEQHWRFVFVDQNMFGDYRLITPLYPGRSF